MARNSSTTRDRFGAMPKTVSGRQLSSGSLKARTKRALGVYTGKLVPTGLSLEQAAALARVPLKALNAARTSRRAHRPTVPSLVRAAGKLTGEDREALLRELSASTATPTPRPTLRLPNSQARNGGNAPHFRSAV